MEIKEIINLPSGVYTADMDGEQVTIFRQEGCGFSIRHAPNKKGWCEVSYYDEDGNYEGEGVEK
jgi:hypothetical protein